VISHLLSANFTVTALTRDPAKISKSFPSAVKLVKADYSSIETLAPALKDQDAIVDLINRNQWEVSIRLIDAAIAAKLPHFIPSSFGIDRSKPRARTLPSISGKIKMEDHLSARSKEGAITFTAIETSLFLDWGLAKSVLFPLEGGKTRLYDGGDVKLSASLLDDIGKAVAMALVKRDSEEVRNRTLYIHSAVVTQNQLIGYAKEANPEKTWEILDLSTEEILRRSWENYNDGDRTIETMRGFIIAGSFGTGLGLFGHVDDDMLGIQELSQEKLKELVAQFVA
jgi:uncharacterized protein YbjT (DUF2867 family)